MSKFNFDARNLINHFSKIIQIKRKIGIKKENNINELEYKDTEDLKAVISNLNPKESENSTSKFSNFKQILKIKTLDLNVTYEDLLIIDGQTYEVIKILNYQNENSNSLKLFVGLK